jgi:S-DNA-T family DNA segregation ATPase FtsK/SpoIIIE
VSTVEETPTRDRAGAPTIPDEPTLIQRERETLRRLLALVTERAEAETKVEELRVSGRAAADAEYHRAGSTLREKIKTLDEGSRADDEARRRQIIDLALAGEAEAKSDFARSSRRIATEFDTLRQRAAADHQKDRSEASAAFDMGEREAASRSAKARRPVDDATKLIESFRSRLAAIFDSYKKCGIDEPPTTPIRETYKFDDPVDALFDRLAKVEGPLKFLEQLIVPKAMKGSRPIWLFGVAFLLAIGPLVWLLDWPAGAASAVVAAIVIGFLLRIWLYGVSKRQVNQPFTAVAQSVVDAEALATYCYAKIDERLKADRARVATARDDAQLQAKIKQTKTISTGEHVRDERLREINETYARRMVEIQTKQQVDLREAIDAHDRRKAELAAKTEASLLKLKARYDDLRAKVQSHHETAWAEMANHWRGGIASVSTALDEICREVDSFGPAWDDPAWTDRPAPSGVPPVVRFGQVTVDLATLPNGISADPRLREGLPALFRFPALRTFADRADLVIDAPSAGRAEAISVVQSAMLRLFTGLPPGAVRFTIIDPIGIGRNFGAFMQLADYDEALVNGQVWTEPRQIEERLADLAGHMERVTQKYLRNDYATIEEYNAAAGEVAEPYRVVVVADFPAGFDEKSAARLAAIAAQGLPCGVITLIATDTDRPLPSGITHADLVTSALNLTWVDDHLAWNDPDFGRFPLILDAMPPASISTPLIQRSAKAARDARRVEVPFEFIAPAEADWWAADSRTGVDIPLGKAGANKRQHLALGKGTSQHVLVAGRTGSGKSTLLHALIVNVALNYSPDEVELYLIDFKKGVEFKVYVTQRLPHAGVVAIESEREFGISVLQRLDNELKLRGDRFRDAGVQDLNGYRNATGTPPLPRILLVVDEFQEFFVEEDKLAQEAALLLDRLVRQGRAFGVHVILGSQTLGGAFTLARTTLGQMAVRIALQCSEADSHLILSEQNAAARLLSRPGEAVYNDANGMVEGNHFFQVVWLPDDRRESYLKQIRTLAELHPPKLARTPIIFEGDAAADLSRNVALKTLLDAPGWPDSPRSAQAWLGEPVAIKEPTSALFRRQGGNHLLIVGQNDSAALGIMAASLVGLAAQFAPAMSDTVRSGAKFFVLDGTPEDHPSAGALARLAALLPHRVEVGGWREVAGVLTRLAEEVDRRGQPDAADGPEIFLMIHDLPRFRDLRRNEEEFSFSRREGAATPADALRSILREGPSLGVHVLIWSDNLSNLNRSFDHQALREFEMRVLFQMSQNDSGQLLDSPAASKLGPHRALFASEEQNRLEKFRPYQIPADEWANDLRDRLGRRPSA